ncbi:MAG: hypothetical protein ABFD25_00880 [Clostridiaceae bacterium]
MELSEKAKQICKNNYKSNCGSCPIRPECVSHINEMDEWTDNINKAAERSK